MHKCPYSEVPRLLNVYQGVFFGKTKYLRIELAEIHDVVEKWVADEEVLAATNIDVGYAGSSALCGESQYDGQIRSDEGVKQCRRNKHTEKKLHSPSSTNTRFSQ